MLNYEKEQQIDAATIEYDGNILNLKRGFHIVGRKSKSIQIDDQSIDEKHALIWIKESGQHFLIDLESIKGTYVDNEKILQSYIITSKTSFIKFGNVLVKYTTLNQSDSGFLDSKITTPEKDTSEIVASSPEQSRKGNGTRFRNRYRKNNLTSSSTPNSKQFDTLPSNEEIGNENENYSKMNVMFNMNADRDNNEDESFIVPETQPFELNRLPKKGNINIFDTIKDENVKQYINDMSRDDDYYVPETQEIFTNSKKSGSDDMVFINTQDFNASENNGSDSNDNLSENLCAYLGKSINNITLKIDYNENKSKKLKHLDETEEMTQLKWNETEYATRSNATTPDFDFENKNEEIEQTVNENNLELEREGSVTPDLIFDNNIALNTSSSNAAPINLQNNEKLQLPIEKETIKNKNISPNVNQEQNYNDYMDDENLLIPTQPFPFTTKCFSPKPKPTINFNDNDNELLEETQLFIDPMSKAAKEDIIPIKQINEFVKPTSSISKKSIVKGDIEKSINKSVVKEVINESIFPFIKPVTINSLESSEISNISKIKNFEDDEENICTQVFVAPQKSCNNENKIRASKTNSKVSDSNYTSTFIEPTFFDSDATQKFILNEIEKENNKSHANDTIENKTNRKRGNTLKTGNEDRLNYEPETKKKVPSNKNLSKTSSNSSQSSYENLNSPILTVSGKSVTSKDAAFMLDVCTPSIDLIKLPISEHGYVEAIKNIKKPKNRIYLEETDDEDDEIIELQKMLNKNEKENTKNALQDNKRQAKTNFVRTNSILPKKETEQNLNSKSRSKKSSTESVKTEERDLEQQPHKRAKLAKVQKKKRKINGDDSFKTSTDLLNDLQTGRRSSRNKSHSTIKFGSENAFSENSSKGTCSTRSSRSSKRNKMTLAFTKVNEAKYIQTVENIGYTIVKNPEEAALIITNNEISRTWKFLIGLAKGIPIVSVEWLNKIAETNFSFVPYDNYYVNDKKAEKKFNFRLRDTINLAAKAKQPLFNKLNFLITENTIPPKSEMEKIINCAGGVLIDSIEKFSGKNLYVVSDRKDSKQWSYFKSTIKSIKILKVEGILLSIMQQRIRFDDHIF